MAEESESFHNTVSVIAINKTNLFKHFIILEQTYFKTYFQRIRTEF